jgi:hypothetical protein
MTLISLQTAIPRAKAGEWGCEVLLCASSSNPSWHAVPSCHPPMDRLIAAMGSWDFSWPTCPEAGMGRPGYERYGDCPAGWTIGYSQSGRASRGEPDLCTKSSGPCATRNGCNDAVSMARRLRSDPYYFDVQTGDGSMSRHWFDLQH